MKKGEDFLKKSCFHFSPTHAVDVSKSHLTILLFTCLAVWWGE
ncbi:hypothetical protein [Methanogenium sp. S4BF]|nr:hypothetical protein [Methanogenium sp. S4BF]